MFRLHESQYFIVRSNMVGSMVVLWWDIVAQETAAAFLGLVVLSWVVRVVSRRGKSEKEMLGESVLVGFFFSEKYSKVHKDFKVIIDGVYVQFSIEN